MRTWRDAVTRRRDVTAWRDMTLWRDGVMWHHDVTSWCEAVTWSRDAVTWRGDVTWWCVRDDVTWRKKSEIYITLYQSDTSATVTVTIWATVTVTISLRHELLWLQTIRVTQATRVYPVNRPTNFDVIVIRLSRLWLLGGFVGALPCYT